MPKILLFLLLMPLTAYGQDFSPFQAILDRHLEAKEQPDSGFHTAFNYDQAIQSKETQADLDKQANILKSFDPATLKEKNQAIAFWINSYNFFMVKIILEKGYEKGKRKVDSVKDFGNFFNPYKIFKQDINEIGGKKYSLDKMEKGILLGDDFKKKGWKDARIHFAVNCASVGCPPLIKKVYSAKTLDQTLNDNIQKALTTVRHFQWKGHTLRLTHLFKWYEKDFREDSGSVLEFLRKHLPSKWAKSEIDHVEDKEYIDYNWKLNRPGNF